MPSNTIPNRFEDGTLNFHGIAGVHVNLSKILIMSLALKFGFRALAGFGGMIWIQQHTFNLCRYLFENMSTFVHDQVNTTSEINLCEIYGNHRSNDPQLQGSIVTFNMRWADGNWIGFNEVGRLAVENNIQIRTVGSSRLLT